MSDAPLTDDDLREIETRASLSWCIGCGEPRYKCACEKWSGGDSKIMLRLLRDLRQARADLAAETATRSALRTQEARISGLLADAGVPVGDAVTGVERLVERVAALTIDVEDAETAEERAGYKREAAEAERDEMREARDRVIAENDRLRTGIAAAVAIAEQSGGVDGAHHKQWVIDTMLRAILGDGYAKWREAEEADRKRGGYLPWDEGIAP